MAFSQPIANEAQVADEGLIRLLRCANASLGQLRQRAEDVVALEDAAELGFCPRQLKTLCGLLDGGRGRIQRRLSIVAGACGAGRELPAPLQGAQRSPPDLQRARRRDAERFCPATRETALARERAEARPGNRPLPQRGALSRMLGTMQRVAVVAPRRAEMRAPRETAPVAAS